MIADRPEPQRVLVAGNKSVLLHRHGGGIFGVQVHDALRLRKGVIDALVKRKGEFVRQLVARLDVIAVLVELMQVGGGDLLEQDGRRVHQELVRVVRDAGRQMREQQFVPVLHRRKPEGGGEIDADFPFGGIHARLQRPGGAGCGVHGVSPSIGAVLRRVYCRKLCPREAALSIAAAGWAAQGAMQLLP